MLIPLYLSPVQAGHPAPATHNLDQPLDFAELIKHPQDTFFVRVQGFSMMDAGIMDGDLLIVDRSIDHRNNDIVVASVDGDLTVKRLEQRRRKLRLMPANKKFKPIDIDEETDFGVWGVVTHTIHCLR